MHIIASGLLSCRAPSGYTPHHAPPQHIKQRQTTTNNDKSPSATNNGIHKSVKEGGRKQIQKQKQNKAKRETRQHTGFRVPTTTRDKPTRTPVQRSSGTVTHGKIYTTDLFQ